MAITLRNASTSTVSLFVPSIKMNRELTPGRKIPVTQEEYEVLAAAPDEERRALFNRVCAAKEAFLKMTGEGLLREVLLLNKSLI